MRRVVEPILSGGEVQRHARDPEYVRDLGLPAPDSPPRMANPIYREVAPQELGMAVGRAPPLPGQDLKYTAHRRAAFPAFQPLLSHTARLTECPPCSAMLMRLPCSAMRSASPAPLLCHPATP